jgi:phage major head subunit gpT-like protein
MAVINTGLNVAGLRSEFYGAYDAMDQRALYRRAATRIVSTKTTENHRWLGTVPQMREWGTGRLAKGLRVESYDVTNLKYESTLEIDRDEIADDQTGQIRMRINELAMRAATHKDYLLANLLMNGESAGYLAYDGQIFFSASHVSGNSGTLSNVITPAATDADVPTAAEFRNSLGQAVTRMMSFKDDQGEPMFFDTNGLIAIVHPAIYLTALEATVPTTSSDRNIYADLLDDIIALPWLTDEEPWWLIKTNGPIRPFIFQDREPIEADSIAEKSEEAFKREKYLFGTRARYAMTYGFWQYAVQSTFTEGG